MVAATVSVRRASIMETNIHNEPNTNFSDKSLLDRFNQPIRYNGNLATLAGLAEDIVEATLREPRGRQARRQNGSRRQRLRFIRQWHL